MLPVRIRVIFRISLRLITSRLVRRIASKDHTIPLFRNKPLLCVHNHWFYSFLSVACLFLAFVVVRFISSKPAKVLEVALISFLTTSVGFVLIWLIDDCSPIAYTTSPNPLKVNTGCFSQIFITCAVVQTLVSFPSGAPLDLAIPTRLSSVCKTTAVHIIKSQCQTWLALRMCLVSWLFVFLSIASIISVLMFQMWAHSIIMDTFWGHWRVWDVIFTEINPWKTKSVALFSRCERMEQESGSYSLVFIRSIADDNKGSRPHRQMTTK